MLEVCFYRDSRQRLSRIFASGHVEIPESSSDEFSLVCAAVSAILQAARVGLESHAGLTLQASQRSGEFCVQWPAHARDDQRVAAIVDTARLATLQIARQYPAHVIVRERADDERDGAQTG